MPEGVGYYGDRFHDQLVLELVQLEDWYRQQLEPQFRKMVQYHRMFLADRDDRRKPHEKWRANGFVPLPFISTETGGAAICDIMGSSDPMIQSEGIGREDDPSAAGVGRLLQYVLNKNSFPLALDMQIREMKIQGTAVWKPRFINKSKQVRIEKTPEEIKAFRAAIEEAVGKGAPAPNTMPSFDEWRATVNSARMYGTIPEAPFDGQLEVIEYRGPWLDQPSIFDLRLDPMIFDWQEQPVIYQRITKTRKWVLDRTGPEASKPYDPRQVQAALNGFDGKRFSEFEGQVAAMLGIHNVEKDPTYENGVELFEVWRSGDPLPYCVLMNRKAIINKTPFRHPFNHGMQPYIPIRNVPLKNRAFGMSDFVQTDRLYRENQTIRDLYIDALVLAVLPLFLKLKEAGITELSRFLRPGGVVETARENGLTALTKFPAGIEAAVQGQDRIRGEIDDAGSTGPNVRGSTSTIGRVSATESERRITQALVKQKMAVIRIEQEHNPLVSQMLFICHQYLPPEVKVRVGTFDQQQDPFVSLTRSNFIEALDADFKFRGASKALNRELSAQQLMSFLNIANSAGLLLPHEGRKLLEKIYEVMGQKGVSEIITKEGTIMLTARAKAVSDKQAADQTAANKQAVAGKVAEGGTRTDVPLNEAGADPAAPQEEPAAAPPEEAMV